LSELLQGQVLPAEAFSAKAGFYLPKLQRRQVGVLPDGVIGNTLDFDSRKSRFEPWSGNREIPTDRGFCSSQEVSMKNNKR